MDQKIKLSDLPICNDLRGKYSINVDADNNPSRTPWDFIQDAVDLKMRALQAVIDNCRMPYVPSTNIDNKNLLHKAYPRLLFQRNNLDDAGGVYYDVDLEAGHNYTLSVQGSVSPAGIAKNRFLRVHIEDYILSNDNEECLCADIPIRCPNIIIIGHSFVCPKTSHYRISIDYCNANNSVASDFSADEYAYLEYLKLEEGAYVTCYADAVDEDLQQANLLPSALQDFSHVKGTVYQREYDGVFMSFLSSTATKANDQILSYVGTIPELKRERSYTLSFLCRGTGQLRCGLYSRSVSDATVQNNFGVVDSTGVVTLPPANGAYSSLIVPLTDTYTKHWYTFSFDHLLNDNVYAAVIFELLHKDDAIELRNVKLECGGRATAYIEDESKSHIVKPTNA